MSEDWLHTCGFCSETIDVTDAGGDPSKVAELLLAHLRLVCPAAPGPVQLAQLVEAAASAELAGADPLSGDEDDEPGFFDSSDLVSLGGVVLRTHHERQCRPPCVIHSPSDHHMRGWSSVWSDDLRSVLRLCPHERLHPDPDDLNARTGKLKHMCDGCCLPPR